MTNTTITINKITPDSLLDTPLSILAQEHPEVLFAAREVAANLMAKAKAITALVDQATDMKYSRLAHEMRLAAGKDTGVIHFQDDTVAVTADLPKKVEWDQKKLARIAQRIYSSGEDVSEYINVKYDVSEAKYKAWPTAFKAAFDDARTLKTGKASYRLAITQETSHV